jgi:hypothetical protein
MKKKLKNYYRILFLIVFLQLISTTYTLSQNIAYGQQIEVLKQKQEALFSKETNLNQAIAQEISIQQLENYQGFEDTKNLLVVKTKTNAVALR